MSRVSHLKAVSKLTVRETSLLSGTIELAELDLQIGPGFDPRMYYGPNGEPRLGGVQAYTLCFTQGLIANLHYAHQMNLWDSAKHLRHIIAELERGFVKVLTVQTSEPHK